MRRWVSGLPFTITTSRGAMAGARYTATWMKANILSGKAMEIWAHDEALLPLVQDSLQLFPKQAKAFEQKLSAAYRSLIQDGYQHCCIKRGRK